MTNTEFNRLISDWEAQQAAYVRHRHMRFEIMLDALEHALGQEAVVVDLGCGLGSLTRLILERFPRYRCIGVDYDPLLLELARFNLQPFEDRATLVDANLLDPSWAEELPAQLGGAVSSTALHWLPNDRLAEVYADIGSRIQPGGLLMNADHLRAVDEGSLLESLSRADGRQAEETAFAQGVPDWDLWWDSAGKAEGLGALLEERTRRYLNPPQIAPASPGLHTQALRSAGFDDVGVLWQYLDDFVVYGSKRR